MLAATTYGVFQSLLWVLVGQTGRKFQNKGNVLQFVKMTHWILSQISLFEPWLDHQNHQKNNEGIIILQDN